MSQSKIHKNLLRDLKNLLRDLKNLLGNLKENQLSNQIKYL